MEPMHAWFLLLLFCSACSYQFTSGAGYGPSVQDSELELEGLAKGEEVMQAPAYKTKFWESALVSDSSTPEAREVPEYLIVSSSQDQKEVFKPEKGPRPLSDLVKEIPLVTAAPTLASGTTALMELVEILCHVDRMYVRIRREVFKTMDAFKYLKLGTCPVNQATDTHYYLLYLLKMDCGFKIESNTDYLSIHNVLQYKPTSPVLREMPFEIPLQCKYPRFFHSYKVGFHPKLQASTVFKALYPKSRFTITPQDALGNEVIGTKTYTLGQPMYFEAKRLDSTTGSGAQRLYINKCFMTASQNTNAEPKYTIIDNYGCMTDGKVTEQSKFLTGASQMVQKFSVGALIFKDSISTSSQQLYMHCDISMGTLTPTQSSKACNYDPATNMWKELYGYDSTCTCCDSTCSLVQPKASNMISSHSWKVDMSDKDGYEEFEPQMKSSDADTISLEDPDMAEHKDFLNYWEHDN